MWWKKIDLEENPFSSEDSEPYGLDKVIEETVYRVESGSIIFIEGQKSMGKTSLLKSLIKRFKGKGRVIYVDASKIDRDINIERLMKARYGFFGRLFGFTPKDMILLVDNVQLLSKKNEERIKFYFDNNYLRSAVFTGESYSKANLPRGLRERIGSRVVKLVPLSEEEAVEAVRSRIGSKLMSREIIKKIYKLSGKNMVKFLQNCNELCEKYIETGEDSITDKDINEFFGGKHGTLV